MTFRRARCRSALAREAGLEGRRCAGGAAQIVVVWRPGLASRDFEQRRTGSLLDGRPRQVLCQPESDQLEHSNLWETIRGKLTFLISDPAKPVKAFERSDAATSRAFPR